MGNFKPPRILTDGESNTIRGKILAGHATKAEILSLVSHFDLVDLKLRHALETLRCCFPEIIYVWGDNEEQWGSVPPDGQPFSTVSFADLLDGLEKA